MAFFDDTGIDEDDLRNPIWGAFALLKDNLERLIAINLGWSIQLIPAVIAFAFPGIPPWVRILLFLYSATILAVATGALYDIVNRICEHEQPRLETVKETVQSLGIPSLRTLAPLYGLLGLIFWIIVFLTPVHLLPLDVVLRLCILCLLVCSTYWGPYFTQNPTASWWQILRQSVSLFWQHPGKTLLTDLVVLLALILGTVSIGGLFLIVPVLVAILQTLRFRELDAREQQRRLRRQKRMMENVMENS